MAKRAERDPSFHPNVRLEYAANSFKAGYEGGYITKKDEAIIREYVREKAAINHITPGRQLKTIFTLIRWRTFLPKQYVDLAYTDILEGIENLKGGKNARGTVQKEYPSDYMRILKSFLCG
jgi:hypothetical protein